MYPILKALTWEYWRSGRWGFLVALAAMVGFPGLLHGIMQSESSFTTIHSSDYAALHLVFLVMAVPVALLAILRVQSGERFAFSQRMYPLPVSTSLLVGWKMAISMVTAAVLYLLAAGLLNLMFAAQLPLWPPAVLFAVVAACAQAMNWATARLPVLQVPL